MPKMIQVRNVPDSLHRKLKIRAANEGLSLSDYLLREMEHVAERPTMKELAERIASEGALVSRFWPDAPPRRDAFRLRNVVTSGISIATVVIDAGPTSGARMQARIALSQGRPVILMRDLVRREQWARRASERRGIVVAASPDEVVQAVSEAAPSLPAHQLSLF